MNLRKELERMDGFVRDNISYGYKEDIWIRMIAVLDAVDALGAAITDAGYTWTPAMRDAYERASGTTEKAKSPKKKANDFHPKGYHMRGRG
jgi:hypothetical protein